MLGMVRFAITAAVVLALAWVATTVPLGNHTLWGHAKRIWSTEEAQDLAHGVEETAGPAVERVKRGVEAGVREAARNQAGAQDAASAP